MKLGGNIVAVALLFLGGMAVFAQIKTLAPMEDFVLPKYDDETGYKLWELRGHEAAGYSEDRQIIDINEMELRTFSGNAANIRQVTIKSPLAKIDVKNSTASGPSDIYVAGPGYTVSGKNWQWYDKEKTIEIRKDVEIVFAQEINEFIKLK